jgi:hypothetical protein
LQFEASPGKKLARPYLKKKKAGMVVDLYNPRYLKGRRSWFEASPRKSKRHYQKNR